MEHASRTIDFYFDYSCPFAYLGYTQVDRLAALARAKLTLKPMTTDEAILEMELLGHDFFVFASIDTELINVLYRRRDGDFGLIEPVVGGGYTKGGPVRSGSTGRR